MTADKPEQGDESRGAAESEPVVVRDRRRIDPKTGERRVPDANGAEHMTESMSGTLDDELAKVGAEPSATSESEEAAEESGQPAPEEESAREQSAQEESAQEGASDLDKRVNELTADLKRVTAEYANYRKRVERDREAVATNAKAAVASDLLTVLDDIERAEAHGDLTGAFKAVADKLIDSLRKAGLESFGEEGDEFDPSIHEAVQHATSPEVSGPTVTTVLRRGYRFGERVLRPAMVGVTDYEESSDGDSETEQSAEQD